MVSVTKDCAVTTSPAVTQSTGTDKGNSNDKKGKGPGTRVFKYSASDYCRPDYVHNDGERAIFICFKDEYLPNVIKILKSFSGRSDIFSTYKILSDLGGFYKIQDFENFGTAHLDEWEAEYCTVCKASINDMVNIRIDGEPWAPTSEVAQRFASQGAYVFPTGDAVHRDEYGAPNVSKTYIKPLFQQRTTINGKWTAMIVHIHPVGFIPTSKAECTGVRQQKLSWTTKSNVHKEVGSEVPSLEDIERQKEAENENPSRPYRSAIVTQYFIYFYSKEADFETALNILRVRRKDIRKRKKGKKDKK